MKINIQRSPHALSLTSKKRFQNKCFSTNRSKSSTTESVRLKNKVTEVTTTKSTITNKLKGNQTTDYVCGLDEAGRGSVLGPLVICTSTFGVSYFQGAAAMTKDFETMLRDQGVKDSKLLSEKKREMFYEMLKDHSDIRKHPKPKVLFKVTHILPHIIDKRRTKETLNTIELKTSITLIRNLIKESRKLFSPSTSPVIDIGDLQSLLFQGLATDNQPQQTTEPVWDTLYIDALTTKDDQYGDPFRAKFSKDVKKIISVNKADTLFTCVGAASVIAKVERDRAVKALERKHQVTLGSGYPSDSVTVQFLKDWSASHDQLPDFVRLSWGTVTNLLKQKAATD